MKKYCFGVDVGGTTIKMGFFDTEGNVLDKWEIPTRTETAEKMFCRILQRQLKISWLRNRSIKKKFRESVLVYRAR